MGGYACLLRAQLTQDSTHPSNLFRFFRNIAMMRGGQPQGGSMPGMEMPK
jgi:hypothetical protein